ncbi:signal recognition particle receptor subunit beta-like isoform X2 [Leptonychotes weddellii]|uniref:Signal recognition particle receptor subunit beta n=1 Tax=Leptonychotes weddellii TaxID=9713 RepID=A0A2U3Z5H6_LEPWE|nr:signal recognition particle receptor subunit beta-like isoform X2 [Leptonychotes weddellii]
MYLCSSRMWIVTAKLIAMNNKYLATSLTLIDLPGHESLRLQFLERFKASARAVVFVVDSAAFQREVKDVAEFLYQVLIDSMSLKNTPSFLIACNKQDITMAKSAKLIQQQLEKELCRNLGHGFLLSRAWVVIQIDGSVRRLVLETPILPSC